MSEKSRPELPRMGGIALRNGVVLVSERHWAAAVRDAGGGISVASGRKPRLARQRQGCSIRSREP